MAFVSRINNIPHDYFEITLMKASKFLQNIRKIIPLKMKIILKKWDSFKLEVRKM